MNAFIAICIVVSLPMSMGLNCYKCTALTVGCNDPFNKAGSGVSTTGDNSTITYCKKTIAAGIVARSGETSCTATGIYLETGIACCQTNLCNGAKIKENQMPIMLIIGLIVILMKIQ